MQRSVKTDRETSFTLTSIQYNPADALLYGMVTYVSGEHFLVRVKLDTSVAVRQTLLVVFLCVVGTHELWAIDKVHCCFGW